MTLDDLKGQPDITFAANEWNAAVSGDGRTIVTVSYAATNSKGERLTAGPDGLNASGEDVTLVVRDGLSGAERLQFHPPVPVLFPHLSEDGSRLVMMVHPDYGHKLSEPRGAAKWYAFDTKTGKVLTSVTGDALYSSGIQHFWIDAGAERLYYLPILGSMDETKPPLLQLYAYDLTTGNQIGHVDLPGIVAGSWSTKKTARGFAILSNYQPGAALSPDGRQLAIVHADAETVTLIDVEHLKVDRTIALTHPSSLLDTVLGMLPLAPHDAAAKSEAGTQLTAVFGPDGQHLYVFGAHGTVDDGGRTEYRGLGLQLIDLRSGTVEAQKLDDTWIYQVLPARDGQNIYVISANGPHALSGADGPETLVRRLDATSLASRGVRSFDGYRLFLLRPAPNAGT
jgi:hypothetical protein